MVELPYQIGNKRIMDVLYSKDTSLEPSVFYAIHNFIQFKLGNNTKDFPLLMKELFSPLSEGREIIQPKKDSLMSIITKYERSRELNNYKGNYEVKAVDYSPKQSGAQLPSYRLNYTQSLQPEGGNYNIGFQFGTRDPLDRSDFNTSIIRDLKMEKYLAQQLTDLFATVEKYGQPQLNK